MGFGKAMSANYHLFQVVDLACIIKLTVLKVINRTQSKLEKFVFNNERTFKKNYLKPKKYKSFHNRWNQIIY